MVVRIMSSATTNLPDDPAFLKAMITALLADNAKMSATLQAHDQLIQTLRLRIAKLKKQVFGKSSEKIEREIERKRSCADAHACPTRRFASAENSILAPAARNAEVSCVLSVRTPAKSST
jgi:hypothetical protein